MFFNRLDEAFGMLCLSISRDIIFHVDSIATPNEVWFRLEAIFGKIGEMRGHQLENELISLSPTHFETIHDFFTKFNSLVLHLKQRGIKKKDDELILSIIMNIGT